MYLADTNFWLALTFESHFHHASAKIWFDAIGHEQCLFCRLTQQGFLRLATNPQAFPEDAVTLDRAWQLYDTILSDPRVAFATESSSLEQLWRSFTQRKQFSPKVWNDAYLAAFAIGGGWNFVTFDQGFQAYAGLKHEILSCDDLALPHTWRSSGPQNDYLSSQKNRRLSPAVFVLLQLERRNA